MSSTSNPTTRIGLAKTTSVQSGCGNKQRERARKYYRREIRRGLIFASNRMLEGELTLDGDTL